MNSVVKGIITTLVSAFLLAYVGYQAYLTLYHPIRTVRADSSLVRDSVTTEGFVLHNETILSANTGGGVVDFTRKDGERVSKGGVVANIYASAEDAANARKLQQVNDEITQLQNDGTSQDTSAIDVSSLDDEISQEFLDLSDQTSGSNLDGMEDAKSRLLNLLNTKEVSTGEVSNFSQKIEQLKSESASLSAGTGGVLNTVKSPISGCFVSETDGYEGMYNMNNILSISSSDVQRLESAKPTKKGGSAGKVVSEYEWYITCIINADEANKLSVGDSVNVQFLLSSENEVPVTVAAVNRDSGKYAVVLKCGYMTSKLAVMRKETIQIINSEMTGIKVSNQYIHFVNDQKGVFVLEGNKVQFEKIVPAYSENGYTVSEIDADDQDRLQVYDEIIVNGNDLYDGKVVR